jgi:hypothetical protein
MKTIIIFFTLVIGGMVYVQHSLQNGTVLKYIDQHSHEKGVPKATFYIGQAYHLMQSLPEATTYFLRVAQRYPDGPLGDDGYFSYLECRDESVTVSRQELIEGFRAYLEQYPNGRHAEPAKNKFDSYNTGGR